MYKFQYIHCKAIKHKFYKLMFLFVIFIARAGKPEVRNPILVNIPYIFISASTLKFIKTMCNNAAFVTQLPV